MANKIVIIGGMGPQASLYFHKLVIDNAAANGAEDNAHYPEVVHFSIPVKDFINADDSQPALTMINDSLSNIHVNQNDHVFLTCNTAHLLKDEIEAAKDGLTITPLMGAVENALAKEDSGLKIGVLASPTTLKTELYSGAIESNGNTVLDPLPDDQKILESIIRDVLANKNPALYQDSLNKIIESLQEKGADKIVVGCTELSVVLKDSQDKSLLDPLKLLVDQNLNDRKQLVEYVTKRYTFNSGKRISSSGSLTTDTFNSPVQILTSS